MSASTASQHTTAGHHTRLTRRGRVLLLALLVAVLFGAFGFGSFLAPVGHGVLRFGLAEQSQRIGLGWIGLTALFNGAGVVLYALKVSDDATGGLWVCADHVFQLFAPTHRLPSAFSRMRDAESIIRNNQQNSERRIDLGTLLMYARIARRVSGAGTGPGGDEECTTQ